jgi:hypothetical protein
MQAQQVLSKGSRKGFGVALIALIVLLGAVLAISFAAVGAGSSKPSATTGTGASAQPVGGYNNSQGHGQLP